MRRKIAVLAVTVVTMSAPAWAGLTITPTFDSTITSDPNAANIKAIINQAIQTYENAYSDPINVTINFQSMSSGLGQSNTTLYKISYQTFINALTADSSSADDTTALAHLPTGAANPVNGTANINVKTANLRAAGVAGSFPPIGGFDGTIGLNTHITDFGSPGTTGQYSLLATAEHEIDEVLGLGSDLPGGGFFSDPAPQDLYRYDAAGNRSYTTNSAAKAYFSIDGTTNLAQFDNQNDGGDFGDWQSNPLPSGVLPKVQDAFATPGAHPSLGVELRALDVVGYNRSGVIAAWNVDANGNWSVAGNWSGGVPSGVGSSANFGTVILASRTVTVDVPETVGAINFNSSNSYVVAGSNVLTLDVSAGQAYISVVAGSHTISAPVTLNKDTTIITAGSTGLALTNTLSAAGTNLTKAGAGMVQFQNVRAASLTVAGGTAQIAANGTPNSAIGTSVLGGLSIASGAVLDLTNNSMVVTYTSVGTLVNDTRLNLQSGRLTSSSATSSRKLGYGDNATLNRSTFAGQSVSTNSLLIKFTFGGDANLDGQVDVTDLGALATHWQTSNVWTGGDFNYDGFVDVSDLGILATNWQAGVVSPLGAGSFQQALEAFGLGNVSVPEPAMTLGWILFGAVLLRRRRDAVTRLYPPA